MTKMSHMFKDRQALHAWGLFRENTDKMGVKISYLYFAISLASHEKDLGEEFICYAKHFLAPYLGSWLVGRKRAWYLLFVLAHNYPLLNIYLSNSGRGTRNMHPRD